MTTEEIGTGTATSSASGRAASSRRKRIFGNSEAQLDDKGRVLLDKEKRAFLGRDFVFVWGELGQIIAFPEETWDGLLDELMRYSPNSFPRQQYMRLFTSNAATELNTDAQGRVVIPSRLRDLAKLDGAITVVGLADRIEIWSRREYDGAQEDPENYNRGRREAVSRAYAALLAEGVTAS